MKFLRFLVLNYKTGLILHLLLGIGSTFVPQIVVLWIYAILIMVLLEIIIYGNQYGIGAGTPPAGVSPAAVSSQGDHIGERQEVGRSRGDAG